MKLFWKAFGLVLVKLVICMVALIAVSFIGAGAVYLVTNYPWSPLVVLSVCFFGWAVKEEMKDLKNKEKSK